MYNSLNWRYPHYMKHSIISTISHLMSNVFHDKPTLLFRQGKCNAPTLL